MVQTSRYDDIYVLGTLGYFPICVTDEIDRDCSISHEPERFFPPLAIIPNSHPTGLDPSDYSTSFSVIFRVDRKSTFSLCPHHLPLLARKQLSRYPLPTINNVSHHPTQTRKDQARLENRCRTSPPSHSGPFHTEPPLYTRNRHCSQQHPC